MYYYLHDQTPCYYCIVEATDASSDNIEKSNTCINQKWTSYYTTLAREKNKAVVGTGYINESDKLLLTVEFNKQKGTGGTDWVNLLEGDPFPTITLPTRKGYEFLGYFEKPNGEGIKYINADGSSAHNWDKSENGIVYANWTISLVNLKWKTDLQWNSSKKIDDFYNKQTGNYRGYVNMRQSPTPPISISTIEVKNGDDGDRIRMIGNDNTPGKGAIWTTVEEEHPIKSIQFEYDLIKGDSFDAGGLMFNVSEEKTDKGEDILTGYMLSFNFQDTRAQIRTYLNNKNAAIFKFKYTRNNNTSVIEYIDKAHAIGFNPGKIGTRYVGAITLTNFSNGYQITVTPQEGDVQTINISVNSEEMKPNSFGFFSQQYRHGCSNVGYFELKKIKIIPPSDE